MKRIVLLIIAIAISLLSHAQELKVIEFRADMTMTDAVQYPKEDANGERCGLIRMGLVIPSAQFEGDIISAEYKGSEWWIYMIDGANWITVKTKKYLPLRYEFEPIRSNVTYVMNIERPQVSYDGPTGIVKIDCNIKDADVYIDGEKMSSVTPYEYKGPEGQHEVEIRANGYNRERTTIEIKLNKKLSHSVTLRHAGSFQLEGISYEMVKVEGGSFLMGSAEKPEDKNYPLNYAQPQHEVVLRPYSIGKTEVTQALWEKVMGSNPSVHQGPNLPVENVSYEDCLEFIRRLNQLSGQSFRLPTEAEWEYAARNRGANKPDKCSGGSASKVAQTEAVSAVGGKKANALGIFDMSGNVAEWCADWIASYPSGKTVASQGPDSGTQRVVRGGHAGGNEWSMFSSSRSHRNPDEPSQYIGLRLAMDN
ncbi:MAG: SUMF1/EgtB/PvdO family nonheme iron enzyme [Bacteroidales bacterium]|nr:SUMF1/EgtB/PvdO family nonheme iron enzyme [Bacteroidales bacterium]